MMARAQALAEPERPPAEEEIARAGDAMLLLIPRAMWETLLRQGAAEGATPGQILERALRSYLEAEGAPEAVSYLHRVKGAGGG